jgi:hypothetical protein
VDGFSPATALTARLKPDALTKSIYAYEEMRHRIVTGGKTLDPLAAALAAEAGPPRTSPSGAEAADPCMRQPTLRP